MTRFKMCITIDGMHMNWNGMVWNGMVYRCIPIYMECIYGVLEHTPAKHTYLYGQGKFFGFKITFTTMKICIIIIIQNIGIYARNYKNCVAYVSFSTL